MSEWWVRVQPQKEPSGVRIVIEDEKSVQQAMCVLMNPESCVSICGAIVAYGSEVFGETEISTAMVAGGFASPPSLDGHKIGKVMEELVAIRAAVEGQPLEQRVNVAIETLGQVYPSKVVEASMGQPKFAAGIRPPDQVKADKDGAA